MRRWGVIGALLAFACRPTVPLEALEGLRFYAQVNPAGPGSGIYGVDRTLRIPAGTAPETMIVAWDHLVAPPLPTPEAALLESTPVRPAGPCDPRLAEVRWVARVQADGSHRQVSTSEAPPLTVAWLGEGGCPADAGLPDDDAGGLGDATVDGGGADAEPSDLGGPPGLTLGAPILVQGRPFGIAVSALGLVAVALLDANQVALGALPELDFNRRVGVDRGPTSLAFDRLGTRLLSANQQAQSVGLLDPINGVQVAVVPVSNHPLRVVFDALGNIYASGHDSDLHVLDPLSRSVTATITVPIEVNGLALHPDGLRLYASSTRGTVAEIDLSTRTVSRILPISGRLQDLVISPDGNELYVADQNGRILHWDLVGNASLDTLELPVEIFGLALSPDGTRLWAAASSAGEVRVFRRDTLTLLGVVVTGGIPRRIAFSPDGSTALISNELGWIDRVQ